MFTSVRRNIQQQLTTPRITPLLVSRFRTRILPRSFTVYVHRSFLDTRLTIQAKMDSDDEALRAAIAASLEDAPSSARKPNNNDNTVVDLTEDTDDDVIPFYPKSKSVVSIEASRDASVIDDAEDSDEDLKRAIALSLQDSSAQVSPMKPKPTSAPVSDQTQTKDQTEPRTTGGSFLALDRKKMEEERLARLSKRKAEESPTVALRELKQPRTESQQYIGSVRAEPTTPSTGLSLQFPLGTVKKTFAFGHRRSDDDIKIEEVLQSSDLELAVLSSFMWDMDWLFERLDIKNSRFILVMQAKDDATKQQYESETASMKNLRLCFPPMEGQVNCMHSKLMLLFHPRYLRIAVPTANLTPYDWGGERGVMENSVFLIDLPKKDPSTTTSQSNPEFYKDLVYFLKASTLNESIIAKLADFDFSKTAQFAFVHTIGGSHLGNSWKQTGYCGLGRSIESLGLRVNKPISLDFVTSSLGSLTPEFMKCIYLAAQGDTGLTELTHRTAKPPSDPRRINASTADEWKDRMRVYFPSYETIVSAKGGPNAAGTICFQSKWYENGKFPKNVLRDCVSVRDGLVMHNKILYVQPDEPITRSDGSQCLGWAYVGSANLSESAWGRLVHDRTTKQPKLNCRNWECGVVVPVLQKESENSGSTTASETEAESEDEPQSKNAKGKSVQRGSRGNTSSKRKEENGALLDIFRGTVPVPMHVPGRKYGGEGPKKPWYFMEERY
ncbi:tyrosyl-DNA phosphodiesterase-domain-containing protein [Aspergillus varians]